MYCFRCPASFCCNICLFLAFQVEFLPLPLRKVYALLNLTQILGWVKFFFDLLVLPSIFRKAYKYMFLSISSLVWGSRVACFAVTVLISVWPGILGKLCSRWPRHRRQKCPIPSGPLLQVQGAHSWFVGLVLVKGDCLDFWTTSHILNLGMYLISVFVSLHEFRTFSCSPRPWIKL